MSTAMTGLQEGTAPAALYETDERRISDIYRRYRQENHFLSMIEHGDVAGVIETFRYFTDMSDGTFSYYRSPAFYGPQTLVRYMARKAAEKAGLSVVKIDEITQRASQKMSASSDAGIQIAEINEMLTELTAAVHEHRMQTEGYSGPVLRAVQYLSLHYPEAITLDALCKALGYSASYLEKIFREETGKTITAYIAWLRCRQAAELLADTELSVSNISSYVGYPDNNYFVKVFKREYRMTPTAYRKEHQLSRT